MPEKATVERARQDKRAGKAATTQAGEFVREEVHHIREGKHGARSTKQAIAIGLSKARRRDKRSLVRRERPHGVDRLLPAVLPRKKRFEPRAHRSAGRRLAKPLERGKDGGARRPETFPHRTVLPARFCRPGEGRRPKAFFLLSGDWFVRDLKTV